MPVTLNCVSGAALDDCLPDLARLRIRVFREYPYLYDGTEAYEQQYLATYVSSGEAMTILAIDTDRNPGEQVVGASTGIPMRCETEEFVRPFAAAGIDPQTLFYCGESVLLPDYRGQGLYKGFFTGREDYARRHGGFETICFCGIVRPPDHPLRPRDYRPLDDVWRHFGYQPRPDLITDYAWKDIDQPEEAQHPMMFWLKSL